MSQRLTDFLEQSALAETIRKVEQGEEVDYNQVLTLQALQIARLGELYALDVIESEQAADDYFKQAIESAVA